MKWITNYKIKFNCDCVAAQTFGHLSFCYIAFTLRVVDSKFATHSPHCPPSHSLKSLTLLSSTTTLPTMQFSLPTSHHYITELPIPSSHHHPLQYTAAQLTSLITIPLTLPILLDHSHHRPLHPTAHPSQYVQLHSHSRYATMHPPTQFSSPQPPTNHQALTSYHKLPIQPSLTACSTTYSGSGSVLRETDPPAATLQPPVRPLLEPHPDSIPE